MEDEHQSFLNLLQKLREGNPLTVEMQGPFSRTLFYENGHYYEQTPKGRKEISSEEAHGYLRVLIARWRRERREQREDKEEKTQ